MKDLEITIGLEVHVHLETNTKMFCGCQNLFGADPNTLTCPVCLGLPGSLPVINRKAIELGMLIALALDCSINNFTRFDRKNYYYPDLPKNYQISQFKYPLAEHGKVVIDDDGKAVTIGITRIHMEEDAGKLIHEDDGALVDYNRTGVPLLEIVSEPDIHSPDHASSYLKELRRMVRFLGISDGDMEKGSLRCDANISVAEKGAKELGVKVEVKNMNSFKSVRDALAFEESRQKKLVSSGKLPVQETRLWDESNRKTVSMRSKEEAHDYRYFPEPDLVPLDITSDYIEQIRVRLPELPKELFSKFVNEYKLSDYQANQMTSERELADYFQSCCKIYNKAVDIANWLQGPVLEQLNDKNLTFAQLTIPVEYMVELLKVIEGGKINSSMAKKVLSFMFETNDSPEKIISEKNLSQISDESKLEAVACEVISSNEKAVNDYRSGAENAIMFLVGQVMKQTKGKANPEKVKEILKRRIDA